MNRRIESGLKEIPACYRRRPVKLDHIFRPQSIAVVGASKRPGTVGNDIFRNLLFHEYTGSVFPVNPKSKSIFGVYSYPTLADIPADVDLGVLIVPSSAILSVVDEAIAKGVKALVVISAGFKEIGAEGAKLEEATARRRSARPAFP